MSKSCNDFPDLDQGEGVTTTDQDGLNSTFGDGIIHHVNIGIHENIAETQGVDENNVPITIEADVHVRDEIAERNVNQGPNLPSTSTQAHGLPSSHTANIGSERKEQLDDPSDQVEPFTLPSQGSELLSDSNLNPKRIIQFKVNPQVEETEKKPLVYGNPQSSSPLLAKENACIQNDQVIPDNLDETSPRANQEPVHVPSVSEAEFVIAQSSQVDVDQGSQPAGVNEPVPAQNHQYSQSADNLIVQPAHAIQPEATHAVQRSISHSTDSEISYVAQLHMPKFPLSRYRPGTPPPYLQAENPFDHQRYHWCDCSSSYESLDFDNMTWENVTLNSSSRSLSPICYELGQPTFQAEYDAISGMHHSTTPRLNGPVAPRANIRIYYPEDWHVYGREHLSAPQINDGEGSGSIAERLDSGLDLSNDYYEDNSESETYSYNGPNDATSNEEQLTPMDGNSSDSQTTVISVQSAAMQTAQYPPNEGPEAADSVASSQSYTSPAPELEPVAGPSKDTPETDKIEKQAHMNVTSTNRVLTPIAFDSQIAADMRRAPARFPTSQELYAILPAAPSSSRTINWQVGLKQSESATEVIDMLDRASHEEETPAGASVRVFFCYLGIVLFIITVGIAIMFRKSIADFTFPWFK